MAARLAVLTLLLAASAACLRAKAPRPVCGGCHAIHYAREGACADCHRGDPAATRAELAHSRLLKGAAAAHRLTGAAALREGGRLVDTLACRRCHTIGGEGNTLATDLDRVAWSREQDQLTASITEPVSGMPRFGLARDQGEKLVSFLLHGGDPGRPLEAYRVHFDTAPRPQASVFETRCGGCHRVLTAGGSRGHGNAGPNLSGLFTAFYPRTARGGGRWTPEAAGEWFRNPRAVRSGTTMPPVELSDGERKTLEQELAGLPRRLDRLR